MGVMCRFVTALACSLKGRVKNSISKEYTCLLAVCGNLLAHKTSSLEAMQSKGIPT